MTSESNGDSTFLSVLSLANTLSAADDPQQILRLLVGLTATILPPESSDLFLRHGPGLNFQATSSGKASNLLSEVEELDARAIERAASQAEVLLLQRSGHASGSTYVVLPLLLENEALGLYIARTGKPAGTLSTGELTALRVAANQAAVGISHWRKDQALISADEDLKTSQIEMMRAAKLAAIGELASDIAHEMTNPLQVLMLHLELMQMGRPLPNWTEMFVTQMKRLSDMTARLKCFARSVSGDVGMERVDLNATLRKTADILQHEFIAKGVRFEFALQENLPTILGNDNYLIQMFLNFFSNAFEAMPQGGTINISTTLNGGRISIGISDTGCGIPEEIRERIFKPFFSTKGETAAGLGLSICLKIARQHGGDISMQSEMGKGTEFRLTLPVESERTIG